jgi:hypothetical protein
MLALKSSANHPWPWAQAGDQAEAVFASTYPAIHAHLNQYREALIKRQDQGEHWWELRACAYWEKFDASKVMYQEIQFHPSYLWDDAHMLSNKKAFFLPTGDKYLLGVLNAPLMWWHNWRYLPHMKDEALTPAGFLMEGLPIARPSSCGRRWKRAYSASSRSPVRSTRAGKPCWTGCGWSTKSRSPARSS